MAPFFHKYIMVTDEIKFIKTSREGTDLQHIQENYPNSIINVNSDKERNIYIGSERVTDNYNPIVDENSITNNVGGMVSGINVSELKGKSISEILDTILFVENNNLALKGVQVVDMIENLTDDTLEEVYQGMVVSVLENNSLYILLTDSNSDSDNEREWKKVGSDIDIEEIKESVKKLSEPITVTGLPSDIGSISNGKIYTTIEDVLKDLLCKEIYPEVSLSTIDPIITFKVNGATASNYEKIMEVGSVLNLNEVTLEPTLITNGYRKATGFEYGYSEDYDGEIKYNDIDIDKKDSEITELYGDYILKETYESSTEKVENTSSSKNCEDVKFDERSVVIGLGSNKITISATSPSIDYYHPEYTDYFVVSNLKKRDKKLSDSVSLSKTDKVTKTGTYENIIEVTGVYPVYANIDLDSNAFVDDMKKMKLQDKTEFLFDSVPSESKYQKHFTFEYPSIYNISFKIKNIEGIFVDFKSTYEIIELDKSVGDVIYNRLTTTGGFLGEGNKYKITLSKK